MFIHFIVPIAVLSLDNLFALTLHQLVYFMLCWPCVVIYLYNMKQKDALFSINVLP